MPNYSEAIEQQLALARELRELELKHQTYSTVPTINNSARSVRGAATRMPAATSVQHEASIIRRSIQRTADTVNAGISSASPFRNSKWAKEAKTAEQTLSEEEREKAFQAIDDAEAKVIALGLDLATPVYISREMTGLITGAMASLPDTTTLFASDLPAQVSWIWLERPVLIPEITPGGYQHHVRAMLVSHNERGRITIVVFGHSTQPERPPMRVKARGQTVTIDDFQYLTRLGWIEWTASDTVARNHDQQELQQAFLGAYADGRPYSYSFVDAEPPYFTKIDVDPLEYAVSQERFELELRTLAAGIIHFIAQKVVVLNPRRLDRAAQRRMPEWKDIPILDVVLLRRKHYPAREEGSEEHEPVDWACRWVVSGHWRQQFYPSEGRHKPKFIPPYVKGPDSKPVRNASKLFAVVR